MPPGRPGTFQDVPSPRASLGRVIDYVRRRGVRSAVELAGRNLKSLLITRETHIWYVLDPAAERPRRELGDGLRLVAGSEAHVDLLRQLETLGPRAARDRLDAGARLWLVLDGDDTAAFACWIFSGSTPVYAAPRGRLQLPPGVSCLEDSVTNGAFRGRGVAPAAWCLVADALRGEGVQRLVTKIEEDNVASRKAILKAGYQPFAAMRHERTLGRRRVTVWDDGSALGRELTRRLGTHPVDGPGPALSLAPAA